MNKEFEDRIIDLPNGKSIVMSFTDAEWLQFCNVSVFECPCCGQIVDLI